MRLLKTTIEGYRSIRDAVDLHVDPHVTVILGANDHGKTNLLDALCHLNPEVGFDEERDLNWDRQDAKDSLPAATYELEFSDPELRELREAERLAREEGVLREFLDVVQAELEAAEEAAGPLRPNAEAAAKALAESEGAANETEGASDEAAEDSAAAEAGEEARSRIAALQGELESANVEAASA